MLGDCLARVDGAIVTPQATLDYVSRLVLGPAGTYVNLSFRRPGPQLTTFYDVRLLRGGAPGPESQGLLRTRSEGSLSPPQNAGMVAASPGNGRERSIPARERGAPPEDPRDRRIAELQARIAALEERKQGGRRSKDEKARLSAAVAAAQDKLAALDAERDRLVREADGHRARLAPIEEELRERTEDLRRFREMHARSQERVREAERAARDFANELAGAQAAHDELVARGQQLEAELARVTAGVEEARREEASKNELVARIEAEAERMAGMVRVDEAAAREVRALLERAAEGHVAVLEALRAQEAQMVQLADVIPALDMAHSALLSAAVPRRLPVDRITERVHAPQLLANPTPLPGVAGGRPASPPPLADRFVLPDGVARVVERRSASPPPVTVRVRDGGGFVAGGSTAVRAAGQGSVLYASSPYFQEQARTAGPTRLYVTAEQVPSGVGRSLYGSTHSSVVSESVVSRRPLVIPAGGAGGALAGGGSGGDI